MFNPPPASLHQRGLETESHTEAHLITDADITAGVAQGDCRPASRTRGIRTESERWDGGNPGGMWEDSNGAIFVENTSYPRVSEWMKEPQSKKGEIKSKTPHVRDSISK